MRASFKSHLAWVRGQAPDTDSTYSMELSSTHKHTLKTQDPTGKTALEEAKDSKYGIYSLPPDEVQGAQAVFRANARGRALQGKLEAE